MMVLPVTVLDIRHWSDQTNLARLLRASRHVLVIKRRQVLVVSGRIFSVSFGGT